MVRSDHILVGKFSVLYTIRALDVVGALAQFGQETARYSFFAFLLSLFWLYLFVLSA